MLAVETYEWVFTAAQTDVEIYAITNPQQGVATYVDVTCANSNSVDVAVRLGFAASTLPTVTNNSASGNGGMIFSHPGIARGGGAVKANGGAPITIGGAGHSLRFSCTVPTGGSVRVLVGLTKIDQTV